MGNTTYTPCEHYQTGQPFAALTFGDIRTANCPTCLAALVIELSELGPADLGAAITFHSGAGVTREPGEDCITITHDLLRNDAHGDKVRYELRRQRLEAQRLRTLGRKPSVTVRVIPPTQESAS